MAAAVDAEAFQILFELSCDFIAYVSYFALALLVWEAQAEYMHQILIYLIALLIMKYIV
jgi:hypothetical protein